MERKLISSGAPWEEKVGYSRAVKVGEHVFVAGTTAVDGNDVVGLGSAYTQTRFILERIKTALEEAGANMSHVVRTRMFLTDIANWEEVGKAHGEFFADIRPAATMVEVSGLINPDMLIEIEVDAIIS